MLKEIDIQMVLFVGVSLLQEFVRFSFTPRIYYFPEDDKTEEDHHRAA